MKPRPDPLQIRRQLYDLFPVAQVAFSADGRDVRIAAPLDSGIVVGSFVLVADDAATGTDPDDGGLVVQVRDVTLIESESATIELDAELVGQGAQSASVRPHLRSITGSGVVVGTIVGDRFIARASPGPFGERAVRPASESELALIVEGLLGDRPSIEIGALAHAPEVAASLQSKGFARHTLMCGQSGSGKTYTTGVLLERLLASTSLPVVVLDPNSDHVRLGSLRDPSDQSARAARYQAVAATVRIASARGLDAPLRLCADFSDLGIEFQALLLRLHPIADLDEFAALRRILAELSAPYSADDVAAMAEQMEQKEPLAGRIARRIRNLGIADWEVWRRGDEPSISNLKLYDERCVVLDLGSLPTSHERAAVALALLGRRWARRTERSPTLIVIDEAHNVLPRETDDPLLQAVVELGVLIAGEGRKFGLHLFVSTQRPAKVHPSVVSQCDNLILMRMNGSADLDELVASFSHVPAAFVRGALGFGLGEALVAGPIAPVPLHVRVGSRLTPEGGADVPTDWTVPA